jgi:hypothetical protein
MSRPATQACTKCSTRYDLPPLPSTFARLLGEGPAHVPFSTYVYAVCPTCGQKDWAEARRYLGFAGPRTLYAMGLIVGIWIVVMVVYLGFFFKV